MKHVFAYDMPACLKLVLLTLTSFTLAPGLCTRRGLGHVRYGPGLYDQPDIIAPREGLTACSTCAATHWHDERHTQEREP